MKKFKGDKCPTCGTEFIEDMCPTQVARRKREKAKRSRAAKKGWKIRKPEKSVIVTCTSDRCATSVKA